MDLLRGNWGFCESLKDIAMETITMLSKLLFSQLGFSYLRQKSEEVGLFLQVLSGSKVMGYFTKYPLVPPFMTIPMFIRTKKFKFWRLENSAGPSFSFSHLFFFLKIISPDNRNRQPSKSSILQLPSTHRFKKRIKDGGEDQVECFFGSSTGIMHQNNGVSMKRHRQVSKMDVRIWVLLDTEVGLTLQVLGMLG